MTSRPEPSGVLLADWFAVRRPMVDAAAAATGSILVVVALTLIWSARLSVRRNLYVSELGATGEPTADVFRFALLLVVVGGSLVAFSTRLVRSDSRYLRAWSPAISLWVASGFFLVASQVTCTSGCPVPYGPQFTWQDLIHIICAVLAFAAACWAMLQVSFTRHRRLLATFSRLCGGAVAVVAATGGLLSLANTATGFGSQLELVATTIAILWLAVYGALEALGHLRSAAA
ncbi:uncharacterized protein DUF998 [Glaciihabitans tibetensis]|uniref:Uncharacterized protein DUF998 n=1 Tax=Glaciihabitans tibetensis TaxID=1266600 RepID=A0A2T0V757_9MICO|nr:DUF998 domain-containing protein [Glaciihabitans tibetensis]PRY65984.1 uncharacterized protein DUF998 [Glaciihabitans tibetensis]